MHVWENLESPEIGKFIAAVNTADQELIATSAEAYLSAPHLGGQMAEGELNLMEHGVLAYAVPADDEIMYEDAAGEPYFEVITDLFVLQSVYNVVASCNKEKLLKDSEKAVEFLNEIEQDVTYIQKQRAIAKAAFALSLATPKNRQEKRALEKKNRSKKRSLALI